MLGSNLSACQVSIKGQPQRKDWGGNVAAPVSFPAPVFPLPFGETKAINPGGLGAAPPNCS